MAFRAKADPICMVFNLPPRYAFIHSSSEKGPMEPQGVRSVWLAARLGVNSDISLSHDNSSSLAALEFPWWIADLEFLDLVKTNACDCSLGSLAVFWLLYRAEEVMPIPVLGKWLALKIKGFLWQGNQLWFDSDCIPWSLLWTQMYWVCRYWLLI